MARRRISPDQRARWLEDYERGITETQIAGRARSDKRTVRDHLQLAMMERAAAAARVEVIKSTALKHQDVLLECLRQIRQSLTLPAKEETPAPVAWHCGPGEDMRGKIQAAVDSLRKKESPDEESGEGEAPSVRALLMEHLKRDPLPKLLAECSARSAEYRRALLNLQLKVTEVLEAETGLRLTMGADEDQKSFLYCDVAGDMAFKYAMKRAFSQPGELPPLPEITVYREQGEVRWGISRVLAVAGGREEEVREALEDALKMIAGSVEVKEAGAAYDGLEKAVEKARRQLDDLLLLGFVTGECRVCRKLGLWTPGGLRK